MTPNEPGAKEGQGLAEQRELSTFSKKRVINIKSYRKNGEAVSTPVVFVEVDGRLYFQTALKSWKAKRMMRNQKIRVVPSTFRGEPKGEWINGTVTRIEGQDDIKRIKRAYIRKLGFISRLFFLIERLVWGDIVFFSIKIDDTF